MGKAGDWFWGAAGGAARRARLGWMVGDVCSIVFQICSDLGGFVDDFEGLERKGAEIFSAPQPSEHSFETFCLHRIGHWPWVNPLRRLVSLSVTAMQRWRYNHEYVKYIFVNFSIGSLVYFNTAIYNSILSNFLVCVFLYMGNFCLMAGSPGDKKKPRALYYSGFLHLTKQNTERKQLPFEDEFYSWSSS